MANAKKCDICGKYYDVPGQNEIYMEEGHNTSMVRILRRKNTLRIDHDVMQFDACEDCLQDVLDYILAKGSMVLVDKEV